MSEALVTSGKPTAGATPADTRALAQVEKWMAVIREIKQSAAKN